MKNLQEYIDGTTCDEAHSVLHKCNLFDGDDDFGDMFERLKVEIMDLMNRNWEYEYEQYCRLYLIMMRESQYR